MSNAVRNINQIFWNSDAIPHLTIRTTYNSVQNYKAHSHAELSIGVIESGSTHLSTPKEQIVLNKGDIVLIEPNMIHACNPVHGMPRSYHMLYVSNDWCCDVLSRLYGYKITQFTCDRNQVPHLENDTDLASLICRLMELGSQTLATEINSYLFNLLSHYCSPQHNQENNDELAYKMRNRLLKDMVYPPSLEILSQEFGRPKESLIRRFKSRFNITPKSFLNNSRVEKAKILLKGGMSIVDVANEVGFSDQSQFHRTFVNYTASTPRQYQQITSIFDNNL